MYITVLWIAKLIQFATRISGYGGAALPGLFVEKISKDFLKHYLSKITNGVVVVSGTNGKTTTTKLIVESLEQAGEKVFTNRSGSNMTRGLISAVISQASLFGQMPYSIAVLEIDEAYAAKFAEMIPVRGAVILNVMRDQLDRFGEIDGTAKLLSTLTNAATDFVVLNVLDARVRDLLSSGRVERVYFGLGGEVGKMITSDDDWHGRIKPVKTYNADYVLSESVDGQCRVTVRGEEYAIKTKLTGAHNHYNTVAAMACLNQLNIFNGLQDIAHALEKVSPAFGRGEQIKVANSVVSLQLVKNPSSFMQTVNSCNIDEYDSVTIVINDAYADGRDVSWLWDVDFSSFKKANKTIASGNRAYDLAVRLRHENIAVSDIIMDESKLGSALIKQSGQHVIFCTYTGMLKLRKFFVKKGHAERVL